MNYRIKDLDTGALLYVGLLVPTVQSSFLNYEAQFMVFIAFYLFLTLTHLVRLVETAQHQIVTWIKGTARPLHQEEIQFTDL